MISFDEFSHLASQYNVIPLTATMLADVHTPVSIYLSARVAGKPSMLFESVEPNERIGRFSFVGIEPGLLIKAKGRHVEVLRDGVIEERDDSVFNVLASELEKHKQPPGLLADGFVGGFAGYIGYDCVKHIERVPMNEALSTDEPDALLGLFGIVIVYDHRLQRITIINNVFVDDAGSLQEQYQRGKKKLEALQLRLSNGIVKQNSFECDMNGVNINSDRSAYCDAVVKAKQFILDGDIFQVVLSRRVHVPFSGNPFPIYRALRVVNPSPYLFFLDFGETRLIGSSPEVLVREKNGIAEVFPIAGTRKRGKTVNEDEALERELLADEKERAEHVMLVDLGRNDLGRICEFGSVEVPVFAKVERFSHVMHLVSEVRGIVKKGISAVQILKACFPAGTVSGAPKVRAMEIISELEGQRRGVYAGAVGYFGLDGTLDTCIAIRTIVAHRDTLSIQSGAGIVADSIPEKEFQETVDKAQALLDAITYARDGLATLVDKIP